MKKIQRSLVRLFEETANKFRVRKLDFSIEGEYKARIRRSGIKIKGKKGQLLERPFIFIFTVVLIGLIFIFGFYLITNFLKQSNCAQIGIFVNDLKSDVDRYYNFDIGSSTEVNLRLPSKINYVCFYNNDENIDENRLNEIDKNLYNVITNVDANIVFLPRNYCAKTFFKIENLRTEEENPLCIFNTGGVNLGLINKGDYVGIYFPLLEPN